MPLGPPLTFRSHRLVSWVTVLSGTFFFLPRPQMLMIQGGERPELSCFQQGRENRAAAPPFPHLKNYRRGRKRKPGWMKVSPFINPSIWNAEISHVAHCITITQNKKIFTPFALHLIHTSNHSGCSGSKNYKNMFSLLVFSILMVFKDQNSCKMDRSSLYLFLCGHRVLCYSFKVLDGKNRIHPFTEIKISVPSLQAQYIFVWVAKPTHSRSGLWYMAYYLFKKKLFEWRSRKKSVCVSVQTSSTKLHQNDRSIKRPVGGISPSLWRSVIDELLPRKQARAVLCGGEKSLLKYIVSRRNILVKPLQEIKKKFPKCKEILNKITLRGYCVFAHIACPGMKRHSILQILRILSQILSIWVTRAF